jgi:putative membrane protein
MLYAGSCALAAAALAHLVWLELPVAWLLWLELGVAAALYPLLSWSWLLRRLVPAARAARAAEQRAELEMVEHGVLSTRDRTSVLILLCELEHRVVILGDQGIHAHLQAGWQSHVATIVACIRRGQAADGVCEVVTALGAVLAEHLPPHADSPNELDNAVRSESG